MREIQEPRRHKCGKPYLFEMLGGMRLYREVRGRRVYRVQCPSCRYTGEVSTRLARPKKLSPRAA